MPSICKSPIAPPTAVAVTAIVSPDAGPVVEPPPPDAAVRNSSISSTCSEVLTENACPPSDISIFLSRLASCAPFLFT